MNRTYSNHLNIFTFPDLFISVDHDREEISVLQKHRNLTAFAGLALIGLYSGVMMATSGSVAWAWLLLVAAIGLVSAASGRFERDHESDG